MATKKKLSIKTQFYIFFATIRQLIIIIEFLWRWILSGMRTRWNICHIFHMILWNICPFDFIVWSLDQMYLFLFSFAKRKWANAIICNENNAKFVYYWKSMENTVANRPLLIIADVNKMFDKRMAVK